MSAPVGRPQYPRAVFANRVADLHAQGLTRMQIAEKLGISRTYAYELLHDPTGEHAKRRKEKYCGKCANCGARISYGGARGLCAPCASDEDKIWTRDAIILALQEWAAEHGEAPRARVWLTTPCNATRPPVTAIQREFGSWNAGLEAAGLQTRHAGHYGRPGESVQCCEEIAQRYMAGESMDELAHAYGCSKTTIKDRAVKGGATIRQHVFSGQPAADPHGVRVARLAAGLSQTQLARLAGVDQPTVSRVEHGSGSWALDRILKALETLAVAA